MLAFLNTELAIVIGVMSPVTSGNRVSTSYAKEHCSHLVMDYLFSKETAARFSVR
jgi:hypothetical protein